MPGHSGTADIDMYAPLLLVGPENHDFFSGGKFIGLVGIEHAAEIIRVYQRHIALPGGKSLDLVPIAPPYLV